MYIRLDLPEKELNGWAIESFFQDGKKYQRLVKNGMTWMVNTPDITKDFEDFLIRAEGSVLINGLGMGMCCKHLLEKPRLRDLTVIEYEKGIYELVAPLFHDEPRCTIVHGDAFTYEAPKGKRYDFVWHDIWTYVSTRNLAEYERLYAKYEDKATWQDGWNLESVKALIEKEKNNRLKEEAGLPL